MLRERRAVAACLLGCALVVALELAPALLLDFARDDFELFSMARIGGFHPAALFVPHRGVFLKPVMNAAWALLVVLLGARSTGWYLFGLLVHLANGLLLAIFAARLSALCRVAKGDARLTERDVHEGLERPSAPGLKEDLPSGPHRRSSTGRTHSWDRLDLFTGAVAGLLWSVHDRLTETIFSLASLNHSLTFTFYLLALLAFLTSLETGKKRDWLLAAGASLLALFSYEVAASLLFTLPLLAFAGRRFSPVSARSSLLPVLLLAGIPYVALQAILRLAPGTNPGTYYSGSAAGAAHNISEIGLAFLHLRTDWISPGYAPALIFVLGLATIAAIVRDPLVRFGLGWSSAAALPVMAIPVFSDRYHYIVFAGLALASGRGLALFAISRRGQGAVAMLSESARTTDGLPAAAEAVADSGAPTAEPVSIGSLATESGSIGNSATAHASVVGSAAEPRVTRGSESVHGSIGSSAPDPALAGSSHPRVWAFVVAAAVIVVHVGWSFAGARELAAVHSLRGWSARLLLHEAKAIIGADVARAGSDQRDVHMLFWWGNPDLNARLLNLYASGQHPERLPFDPAPSRSWPLKESVWPRLGFAGPGPENLSVYVRPEGILGAVRPVDLFNLAGTERGLFYEVPDPVAASRALEDGSARIDPVGLFVWASAWRSDLPAIVADSARQAMVRDRKIPVSIEMHEPALPPAFHLAYLRRCSPSEAFAAEYGPSETRAERPTPDSGR